MQKNGNATISRQLIPVLLVMFACLSCRSGAQELYSIRPPDLKTVKLKAVGKLDKAFSECSGLTRSSMYEGLFWAHGDSDTGAYLYPFYADSADKNETLAKVHLPGIKNRDWEDITSDNAGRLIIGDMGNNGSKDLVSSIYIIGEPDPFGTRPAADKREYHFSYADYKSGPGNRNFDCEAIFWFSGKLYLLTKHRSDSNTTLYRFDNLKEDTTLHPKKIAGFTAGGQVTAAEMSPSGKSLAILTYKNVWVFTGFKADNFFSGTVYYLPIRAKQCEAVSFVSEDALLICNEQRDIFFLKIASMVKTDGASRSRLP